MFPSLNHLRRVYPRVWGKCAVSRSDRLGAVKMFRVSDSLRGEWGDSLRVELKKPHAGAFQQLSGASLHLRGMGIIFRRMGASFGAAVLRYTLFPWAINAAQASSGSGR